MKKDEFVDANREKCIKASIVLYSVLATYTNSEASTIVRRVTGLDGVEAWSRETPRELQQKNTGSNVQGATCMHAPETSNRRGSGGIGDLAVGREVESRDV